MNAAPHQRELVASRPQGARTFRLLAAAWLVLPILLVPIGVPTPAHPQHTLRLPSRFLSPTMVARSTLSAVMLSLAGLASAQLQVIAPGGPNLWWGTSGVF